MAHKGYRERSREAWGEDESNSLTIEEVNCGALLRIADACEAMQKDREMLERDRAYWKDRCLQSEHEQRRLWRKIYALRSVITRMKRKIALSGGVHFTAHNTINSPSGGGDNHA
jgi:hypothetical protein